MEEKEASISELCKQLGSGYRILTIDLERCIYRDFGNGFNVEISGVNTKRKNHKASIYLWYGDSPPECLIIKTVRGIDRTAAAISDEVERLYDYTVSLIHNGLNNRRDLMRIVQSRKIASATDAHR